MLVERPGHHPRLFFQKVPEGKIVKNRVHLDLGCRDMKSEAERLVALGARIAADQPGADRFLGMFDVEGNEFCLMPG